MTIQEEMKKDLELIVKDTCEDIRLYPNRGINGFVTECVSAIRGYLNSKGLKIQTGVSEIIADSPATIEVPLFESLIEAENAKRP